MPHHEYRTVQFTDEDTWTRYGEDEENEFVERLNNSIATSDSARINGRDIPREYGDVRVGAPIIG